MSNSVVFNVVTKKYKMYNNPKDKLKGVLFPDKIGEDFFALQNVSFTAQKGDVIGVIGVNGAGKSTLSNLIAGITPPSTGEIKLTGQASLIAINSGLNGQLTGRENIELKCLMLGFSKKQTNELMPNIEEFADIGKFIDQPVKSYSSGMKSRLGFAISIHINPDILVIDEALSVGDQTFTNKCLEKMNEFKEKGKTIFFISHSIGQVRKFCQKVLWLEAGTVREYGSIEEILPKYQSFLKEYKAMSNEEKKQFKQMINEKRSKLIEQPFCLKGNDKDTTVASRVNRSNIKSSKKRMKNLFVLLVCLIVVGAGLFTSYKFKLMDRLFSESASSPKTIKQEGSTVPSDKNSPSSKDSGMKEKHAEINTDIRYVNVRSAYIRSEHDLESQAVSVTSFGSPYKIEDTYDDEHNDMEWLQITSTETSEETGWISSKLLTRINDKSSDEVLTGALSKLLGVDLHNNSQMLGEYEEQTKLGDKEYTVRDGRLTSFTFHTSPISKDRLASELGQPSLEMKNAFLYVGRGYYYVIDLAGNGNAETITIGASGMKKNR